MPDTYTTISGDTWDGIALEVYGSEAEADWLMQQNPQYITTTKFASSVVLQTPAEPVTAPAHLPPWKRGG